MATPLPLPPYGTPFIDPTTGAPNVLWQNYLQALENSFNINAAPKDAEYWTSTSNSELTNERNIGTLATGYLKIVTAIGIATPSTTATIPASDIGSGKALTKTDDTNVTLTLGGTPATALLKDTSITAGWSGQLSAARGGTGVSNATQTYTPTLTGVANVAASTAYPCQYMRVGNVVTVSGKVDIDPTAGATLTQLGISLPIASNFAHDYECGGTAVAPGLAGDSAAILADATNNRAELDFTTAVDVTNQSWFFSFTYQAGLV